MIDASAEFAPGCFGSAMTFNKDLPECASCPFAARCEPESLARREMLRVKFGIEPKPKRRKVVETEPKLPSIDATSRVRAALDALKRAGINVVEDLAAGINPFPVGRHFAGLRVTCHLLLHLPTGLDRPALTHALTKKLQLPHETATSHAAQAIRVLNALGVVSVSDQGRITLKRTAQ